MKIAMFLNGLTLGGAEKAAIRWARGLRERGHAIHFIALADGPRRAELENECFSLSLPRADKRDVADALAVFSPDAIHAHAPGQPHSGDILGASLKLLGAIPVVQTNVFGRLDNPGEDSWVSRRLFVSWTSCVQAARRAFRPMDASFFRTMSVAVNPLDADDGPAEQECLNFRRSLGIEDGDVLFGRLSRPEPNKWTELPLQAFRIALKKNRRIKLLLREPPPEVAAQLKGCSDRDAFVVLPMTADVEQLRLTIGSLDAVLHASLIGESFGYGIAEPMNFAKPVIANSTPWGDQAQVELVLPDECGYLASVPRTMAAAILRLASDRTRRRVFGERAQEHIRTVASPEVSILRLERTLQEAAAGADNAEAEEDMRHAREVARHLDACQFGNDWREQAALRPRYYRTRFSQWRGHVLHRTGK